jgi:replication factor A1
MSFPALTNNAIRTMTSIIGKPPADLPPMILQIINLKVVASTNGDRYRVMLSDGTYYVTGMLASQVMNNPSGGGIGPVKQDCIIRVDDFMCNEVSSRHVIILLGITVLAYTEERIGAPVDFEKGISGSAAAPAPPQPLYNSTNNLSASAANNVYMAPERPSSHGGGNNPYGRIVSPSKASSPTAPIVRSTNIAAGITPIASLNMYNNRWTIQARVTVKSDIRTWSNAKGEGSLFSVELLDSTQDIRGTFFKEAVDKFYGFLQVGKVYQFTGGRLKVANMQYNNCKSPYEITFDQNTEIHLSQDDGGIDKVSYDFVKIAAIEHIEANKNIDLLAIVKTVSEPSHLISKKTGQELVKCDVTLTDDSGCEISLTIWGDKARTAQLEMGSGNPVVAFRRARVGDYNGKSLSAGPSYEVRPEIPAAAQMAAWWQQHGGDVTTLRSLSGAGGMGGRGDSLTDRKPIVAIKQENMGLAGSEKADWISFKATLSFIKKDKEGGAWYTACANSGEPCKNRFKCSQTTDGQYYCDKCQGTYPEPVRRWIFSGVVEDSTSSTWVSFFNEQAESLLGCTADECYRASARDGNLDADTYDSVFAKVLFKEFIFKCKVKNEFHNDENRTKTSVFSISPVDYAKESNDLLEAIAKF